MLHTSLDRTQPKGWFFGPWNSGLPVPVGYANQGVNERHLHAAMFEVYLVAQGESVVLVDDCRIVLHAGDCLVVEPGEVHTFLSSSDDYFHFVFQSPFSPTDKTVL